MYNAIYIWKISTKSYGNVKNKVENFINKKKLKLKNFKNYDSQKIKLKKGIKVIYGVNEKEKTNILEVIFLCSMGN